MNFFRLAGACALACTVSAPLWAAECAAPTIAFSEDGTATYSVPTETGSIDRAAEYGTAPGPNHILVTRGDEGYWIPRSDLDAAQVLLGTSAESYRYEGPDNCAPKDLPIELTFDDKPAEDLGLSTGSASVQPESGVWMLSMSPVTFSGCPTQMTRGMPADMVSLPAEANTPQPLTFKSPFHPDQLKMSKEISTSWRSLGPNRWETRAMDEFFSQAPAYNGKRSHLLWTLTVHGPEKITHRSTMHVVLPPEAVAAFGSSECSATSTGTWTRVGD